MCLESKEGMQIKMELNFPSSCFSLDLGPLATFYKNWCHNLEPQIAHVSLFSYVQQPANLVMGQPQRSGAD